ncbi:MAG: beta-Ala-His dipeptidase [Patescibacteria group bacterium]
MEAIQNLEDVQAHPVLGIFKSITAIPHPSGQETALGDWVIRYALERGWLASRDQAGNVLVTVPATSGLESRLPICFQAHLDMVCLDGQGNAYGAERYPLELRLDGDWLSATGTTLGADNGIGVALALALADDAEHGPLELLFTVEEETGLNGAAGLDMALKSKILLNLDSEDWGMLFIGCAGGTGATITAPCDFAMADPPHPAWLLTVDGLQGGHSGLEINKGRVNAVGLLAGVLDEMNTGRLIRLVSLTGGSRSNAIPASAQAVFTCDLDDGDVQANFEEAASALRSAAEVTEPGVRITLVRTDPAGWMTDAAVTDTLLGLILDLPNGVISMSPVPEIPQTSINLGVARLDQKSGELSLVLMARSSADDELVDLEEQVSDACRKHDENPSPVTVTFSDGYPGWEPLPDSPLVQKVASLWQQRFSVPLTVTAVHAGLECGLLRAKFPDMEMVSLGPDIRGAHSAQERVNIPSVNDCYVFLRQLVLNLA